MIHGGDDSWRLVVEGQRQRNSIDHSASAHELGDAGVSSEQDALIQRVGAVLAEVFSEPGARARREAVIAAAGGEDAANHDARLADLDRLIDAIVLRLHGPEALRPAAPEAVAPTGDDSAKNQDSHRDSRSVRAKRTIDPALAETQESPGQLETSHAADAHEVVVEDAGEVAAPPPLPPQLPVDMPALPPDAGLAAQPHAYDEAAYQEGEAAYREGEAAYREGEAAYREGSEPSSPPRSAGLSETPLAGPPPPLTPPPQAPEELGPIIPPMVGELRAVGLLYEDIIWLVSIDDWPAALISLERLLVMAELAGHVKEFVDVNEVKLLNVYETFIGPFSRVPSMVARNLDNAMPSAYRRSQKIAQLVEMIDGERTLKQLLRESPVSPLETCSVVSQLRRSAQLELSAP